MSKILSSEDGNLSSSIRNTRTRAYKDIDLTLAARPDTGDIYKKNDAAAVKQAVKTLLLANRFDKPFDPSFGANLQGLLFDLSTGNSEHDIKQRIMKTIQQYEPRAIIRDVRVSSSTDLNAIAVRVEFAIKNISEREVIDTTISRLR
jgi:phage baseplate assembly protein W